MGLNRRAFPTYGAYRRAYKALHERGRRTPRPQTPPTTLPMLPVSTTLLDPIDLSRVTAKTAPKADWARDAAQQRGNSRTLRTHEPIALEQLLRGLRDAGLPTNDMVHLNATRARARQIAWHVRGRLTDAQIAQVVEVVRAEKPSSYLSRAVRVALQFAETEWSLQIGAEAGAALPSPHARPTSDDPASGACAARSGPQHRRYGPGHNLRRRSFPAAVSAPGAPFPCHRGSDPPGARRRSTS